MRYRDQIAYDIEGRFSKQAEAAAALNSRHVQFCTDLIQG